MAIFGKIDAKALASNVAVVNGDATVTTTGSFTNTATADYIEPGDILALSGVQYIVREVTSATSLELHKVYAGSTGTVTAANAIRRTAPKAVAQYVVKGGDTNVGSLIFVDTTEVALNENRVRGLTSPGWWVYKTYTDAAGKTRHKSECIAVVKATAGVAGDYSDNPAADVASAVTISVQPANSTSSSGAGTFTLTTTTTGTPGTLIYQWQRQTASGTTWRNVTASLDSGVTYSGMATDTLSYSGLATTALNGYKYRVKVTSEGGTEEVISNGSATLTFGT